MSEGASSFVEVCIYKVKPDRTDEFEDIVGRVVKHHREFLGVRDVRYMKRTHRPGDFTSAKKGLPAIKLTRKPKEVTYVLYWELDNEVTHGKATGSGLQHFFKDFARCLVTTPNMILGQRIQ
jgi:heme-degrading monooxygenase HmoA